MSAMDANEALLRPANNVGTIDRHARLAMFLSTPDYYESAVWYSFKLIEILLLRNRQIFLRCWIMIHNSLKNSNPIKMNCKMIQTLEWCMRIFIMWISRQLVANVKKIAVTHSDAGHWTISFLSHAFEAATDRSFFSTTAFNYFRSMLNAAASCRIRILYLECWPSSDRRYCDVCTTSAVYVRSGKIRSISEIEQVEKRTFYLLLSIHFRRCERTWVNRSIELYPHCDALTHVSVVCNRKSTPTNIFRLFVLYGWFSQWRA